MSRPRNPHGDPVAVRRKGDVFKVRYYPTGVITTPDQRKELPGAFHSREHAETQAAVLRARLLEHRLRHTPGAEKGRVRLSTAAREFIEESERAADAKELPNGTFLKIKSDIGLYVLAEVSRSDCRVKDLPGALADKLLAAPAHAKKRDGLHKAENTISASQSMLRQFGAWLVVQGYLDEDPFAASKESAKERTAERKKRERLAAVAQVESETFLVGDYTEQGLGLDDVPSLALVSALSDAMFRREAGRATIRNSRLRPLDPLVARQLAAMPLFRTATGLRHCETLAVHTSRIDVDRLTVGVDRQLVRGPTWPSSGRPVLAPPKHNRKRVAQVWPMFAARLQELVEWAEANTDGWLFAPPRHDSWWTENADQMWERAVDLMAREHQEGVAAKLLNVPPLWTWKAHYTRHAYGSYSLAPQSSGGLGWSTLEVSQSMGHASQRTTEDIYRHTIGDEHLAVKRNVIEWPNLDS